MKKTIYTAIKILTLIGIALAIYLLWERYFHPNFQPCNITSIVNCNAIITGKVSSTFGIPTPFIGLMGYLLILLGVFWKKAKFILGVSVFGLLFCLWIGLQEIFFLHVVCPVCILCQMDMISIFILSVILVGKKKLT